MQIEHAFTMAAATAFLASCAGSAIGLNPVSVTPLPTFPPAVSQPEDGPAGFYPLPKDEELVSFAGGIGRSGDEQRVIRTFGSDEVTIDYDPDTRNYTIAVPGHVAGHAVENTTDATPSAMYRYFDVIAPTDGKRVGWASVATKYTLDLSHTAIGGFSWGGDHVWFVTGIPTPRANVPVSGSATYEGQVKGWSTEGTDIAGSLVLNFEFARALLGGSMSLTANNGSSTPLKIGDYQVINGTHSLGSNRFTGNFLSPGGLAGSTLLEGSLMGPDASEVGGRWRVPIRLGEGFPTVSRGDYEASGVFAGRRR